MKIIERVVKSAGSPGDNDLWLKEEGDNLSLKAHHNGSWKTVAGGGGGGGGATRHMVVYGEFQQGESQGSVMFVPNDDEQPTFAEAVEAFESGIPVMLMASDEYLGVSTNVLCHMNFNEGEMLVAFFGEGYMFWSSDESPDPDPGSDPK